MRIPLIGYFLAILLLFAVINFLVTPALHKNETLLIYDFHESRAKPASATSSNAAAPHHNSPQRIAGLSCERYGGPDDPSEMVYWENIPSDAQFQSPLHQPGQYLTLENDGGGFNNIRMGFETILAIAAVTGRTLVLPPVKRMYLLTNEGSKFGFQHFFHMEAIHEEHVGINIITMKEFLEQESGNFFRDGKPSFPPENRTDWDGQSEQKIKELFDWLRSVSVSVHWNPNDCMAVFPSQLGQEHVDRMEAVHKQVVRENAPWESYVGKPIPVNSSTYERMKESRASRPGLCMYNVELQNAMHLHFPVDFKLNVRYLVHFYAFVFTEDWRHDLWLKRFIRDHIRYVDEIQCAAARIIHKLRSIDPLYDAFHIRRGDFQFTPVKIPAAEIYDRAKSNIPDGTLVYVATDEKDKSFFKPLAEHYRLMFLDDFKDEIGSVNSNFYGMIEQLVASRSRTFFGCWFSTLTGYINRLRGYHADEEHGEGYEDGIIQSYYYARPGDYDNMRKYFPVKLQFYAREFPTSWRNIDLDIDAGNTAQ